MFSEQYRKFIYLSAKAGQLGWKQNQKKQLKETLYFY